jgi:hypothetical protein
MLTAAAACSHEEQRQRCAGAQRGGGPTARRHGVDASSPDAAAWTRRQQARFDSTMGSIGLTRAFFIF